MERNTVATQIRILKQKKRDINNSFIDAQYSMYSEVESSIAKGITTPKEADAVIALLSLENHQNISIALKRIDNAIHDLRRYGRIYDAPVDIELDKQVTTSNIPDIFIERPWMPPPFSL